MVKKPAFLQILDSFYPFVKLDCRFPATIDPIFIREFIGSDQREGERGCNMQLSKRQAVRLEKTFIFPDRTTQGVDIYRLSLNFEKSLFGERQHKCKTQVQNFQYQVLDLILFIAFELRGVHFFVKELQKVPIRGQNSLFHQKIVNFRPLATEKKTQKNSAQIWLSSRDRSNSALGCQFTVAVT